MLLNRTCLYAQGKNGCLRIALQKEQGDDVKAAAGITPMSLAGYRKVDPAASFRSFVTKED